MRNTVPAPHLWLWTLLASLLLLAAAPAQATTLSTGYDTSCSVSNDWVAQCWGALPLAKTSTAGIADLRAGKGFNCALRKDETVSCWGTMGSIAFGPATADTPGQAIGGFGRPPSWLWAPPMGARSARQWCTAGATAAEASAARR